MLNTITECSEKTKSGSYTSSVLSKNGSTQTQTPWSMLENKARRRKLVSIVLPTQETEIRRTVVESKTRQIDYKTQSQKNPSNKRAG
jgi:hypothetical protein